MLYERRHHTVLIISNEIYINFPEVILNLKLKKAQMNIESWQLKSVAQHQAFCSSFFHNYTKLVMLPDMTFLCSSLNFNFFLGNKRKEAAARNANFVLLVI